MRGRNRPLAVIAVWALVGLGALFSGCSDNDNVAAPSQTTLTGTPLNASTSEAAAGVSANTVELMSNIGVIFAGIATKFPQPPLPTGPSPLLPIPLPGGSGLCTGGATLDNVIWNDNDSSEGPSAGDTITVNLQDCILEPGVSLSGTPNPAILYTLTYASDGGPPWVFRGTLALNFTVTDSIGTTDIEGTMAAEASTMDFIAGAITLGADNGTSANTQITLSEGGASLSFGCFYVHLDIEDVENPGYFSMWTRGITKMSLGPQSKIMQIGDYADLLPKERLDFNPINGGWEPFQGTLKLLEFDSRGDHGLKQCYGGPTTGTTSELVTSERHEQFDIVLDTFKNTTWSGTPDNTIYTNWGALLDF